MCGINAIVNLSGKVDPLIIHKMNDKLAHRGPDDSGVWHDEHIALGHRRLSIIDLSADGHQPMKSACGRYYIVFNGEIYNYKEVKQLIQTSFSHINFQTQSDTEVIINAYKAWGVDCLSYLNGMFAFVLYDVETNETLVVRDRLGVKPLYYFKNQSTFFFSSEIRPLLETGFIERKVNETALHQYVQYQTVYAPNTIVDGIYSLPAATYMLIKEGVVATTPYWSASTIKPIVDVQYNDVVDHTRSLLYDAVKSRLVADVPFGAFLSGGIDSSIIVALMSQISNSTVKTFSVVFDEQNFSEAPYARQIADKYQTEHTEIKLTVNDFKELLPFAVNALDHPSGDGPNTYVVSKVTKEAGITMALSGIGGDELFAGYDVFKRLYKLQHEYAWIYKLPQGMRQSIAQLIVNLKPSIAAEKLQEILSVANPSIQNLYPINRALYSTKNVTSILVGSANSAFPLLNDYGNKHLLSSISYAEITTYLQHTLLRDTDQMSMAVALEVREPFLDYKLVEYVLSLPDHIKYPSTPKKLLVDAAYNLLPKEIVNRPKMGFTLPWVHWMKNDLKSYCEERLFALAKRDQFNEKEVQHLWTRFLNNDPFITWSRLWHLVVLENWLQQNNVN